MPNLLLLNISGARYGVWEDAVPSVIDAVPLHQLPLSPPVIAGIAILEDRSAVIADMGACLGRPPLASHRNGTFLIIDANDKIAGFCVEGKVEGFECPPERVLSLPPAVATPVADTCAIRGASLIPIINIRNLHDRLKQGLLELPFPEPGSPVRANDLSGVRGVRVLSVDGARFCVDAGDTGYAVLGEGGIAPVPVQSKRLAGVVLHDGAVVPVMLPGEFLGSGKVVDRKGILLAGPQGARYGVVVDQDLGVIEGPDLTVLALPMLAARPWLPAAALAKGKICLLVDSNLFAAPEETVVDQPMQAAFTPSSQFPMQFRKIDTAIVEFSLLGARHAVPQEEMKDDLAFLPIVPVPGMPELVLGVAELRGELLPVLDLAALFGRRSPIGKKSRMMHIVNGDFQALVITEEVAGSRRLPVETQRQVPIALPHQVLYGCYLDAGMVRLILNVEALAVHFEKTAVRELVASLSPELMETHALETESTAMVAQAQHPPVASSGLADLPADSQTEALEADQEQERAAVPSVTELLQQPEENARPGQDIEAGTARDEQPVSHTGAGDAAPAAVFEEEKEKEDTQAEAAAEEAARQQESLRAEDEARSRAVEQERLKAEADAKVIEEKRAQDEAEKIKSEADALARAEAEAGAQKQEAARRKAAEEAAIVAAEETRKLGEEESRRKAEELAREAAAVAAQRAAEEAEQQRAAEEAKKQAAEEEVRKQERETAQQQAAADARKREEEAEQQAAEQARIAAAEAAQREADEARQRKEKESEERAAFVALVKHRMMLKQQAEPKFSPEPGPEKVQPSAGRSVKYLGIAALIVFLLALVIYFGNRPKRPELQGTSMPEKIEKQAANQKANQKAVPQPEKEPPLYLSVPPSKAISAPFVYTVVKGDNLWNIAKRFTGNPLNYPRVARDNSIATPALIFPGQKIRLMQ